MGRVWASVRREFRISWSLLPFAKGDLSRPWDITVHAADMSLLGMGVAVFTVKFQNAGDSRGQCAQLRKPEEVGLSDRDLFNLKDYQALCLGTRAVFPEVPAELCAAKDWRERIMKQPFGHIEPSAEKPFAGTSSLNPVRQNVMGVRGLQRSVINLVGRPTCTGVCVVSVFPLMPVFAIGGSRQSLIQQTSRHEDSSGHYDTMRVSARIQARDCRDTNWFWMSSAHRVLTATLCNESKRK